MTYSIPTNNTLLADVFHLIDAALQRVALEWKGAMMVGAGRLTKYGNIRLHPHFPHQTGWNGAEVAGCEQAERAGMEGTSPF